MPVNNVNKVFRQTTDSFNTNHNMSSADQLIARYHGVNIQTDKDKESRMKPTNAYVSRNSSAQESELFIIQTTPGSRSISKRRNSTDEEKALVQSVVVKPGLQQEDYLDTQ